MRSCARSSYETATGLFGGIHPGGKRASKKRPQLTTAIRDCLLLLKFDAFDPRLSTHKLKGNLNGCWASSATYDLRIIFEFITLDGAEVIHLMSVGTHDQVY